MDNQQKRLTRSMTNKVVAGVCGGLGEYFNIDPVILRILFVAMVLWGGSGVLLYIVMWLVIPEAGKESEPMDKRMETASHEMKDKAQSMANNIRGNRTLGAVIIGAILIIIGLSSIAQIYLPWHIFRWNTFWPLIIVALGLAIIFRRK